MGAGMSEAERARKGTIQIGDFELDLGRGLLLRGGRPVSTRARSFALLVFLAENANRVVSRDEIFASVWNGVPVTDDALTQTVRDLRNALDDDAQKLIKTVTKRGYILTLPGPPSGAGAGSATPEQFGDAKANVITAEGAGAPAAFASPPHLSIVVLPFGNIGGDPEQEYFVDGVTESLTTDVSRIRKAHVVARNTAFDYKGKPRDVKTIGRELNVRYVVEGSVQRGGNRMRVNVQLIDAETGSHLWADRFDKPLADLFDMQDEIVARLANTLDAQLSSAEARRAEQAPKLDSMDLYFRGLAWLNKGRTPDNVARARDFFDRALAADPDNVDALIGSAVADLLAGFYIFVTDSMAAFAAAEVKLTKALSAVPDHAGGHRWLGFVELWTKRAAEGIAQSEHALELDRNLADAHVAIGLGKIYIGRAEETEAHIVDALRLSPRDTMAYSWMAAAGLAKLHLGNYPQAIAWFRRALEGNRNYSFANIGLAVALSQLGRLDEAHYAARAGLALNPTFVVSRARATWTVMSDDPTYLAQLDPILEGLTMARVPEQ
jgi:TolB-like protein